MARRNARRQIADKFDSAASFVRNAETKLAEVVGLYLDGGEPYGRRVDMLREGVAQMATLIDDVRRESP